MQSRGSQLDPGSLLGGYRIDQLIGRGGMGMVYRATNVALRRIYALKVLAPELADDDQFRERFKREMRIAAQLNHPNVIGIHYAGEQDGMLFLAMDLVDGTDLRDLIVRAGILYPERAIELLAQVTSALDAAHHKGLIHRDVKPANVLISVRDGYEHAYLTDFGLAKSIEGGGGDSLSATGAALGTVHFMPPEQIEGGRIDARTDVYALGCVLFQMLTGKLPYDRENPLSTLYAHVHEPPPPLVGKVGEENPAFNPVIAKAMAKDPKDRYQSAGDLARDAEAALKGNRYLGAPTIVATGDARPYESGTGKPDLPQPSPVEKHTPTVGVPQQPVPAQPAAAWSEPPAGGPTPEPPFMPPTQMPPPPTQMPPPAQPTQEPSPAQPTQMPSPAQPTQEPSPAPPTQMPPPTPPAQPPPAAGPTGPSPESVQIPVSQQAQGPPSPPSGPAQGPPGPPSSAASRGFLQRFGWPLAALVVVAAAVVAVIAVSSGGSSKKAGGTAPAPANAQRFASQDAAVPTNHVTGNGSTTLLLSGNQATVKMNANGLLNGQPHFLHIHAGARGRCPVAADARLHNGNLAISTGDGIHSYGHAVTSLTTTGDTSPKSIVDFTRYPSVGNIRYSRTITLNPKAAAMVRQGTAVIVVHGVSYNGATIYTNVLGISDLKAGLPGTATAPALCGPLKFAGTTASRSGRRAVYTASIGGTGGPAPNYLLCHVISDGQPGTRPGAA